MDLPRLLRGETVFVTREGEQLRAPDAPAKGLEMFMVLLGPGSGCQTKVIPGKPLVFPTIWHRRLGPSPSTAKSPTI